MVDHKLNEHEKPPTKLKTVFFFTRIQCYITQKKSAKENFPPSATPAPVFARERKKKSSKRLCFERELDFSTEFLFNCARQKTDCQTIHLFFPGQHSTVRALTVTHI